MKIYFKSVVCVVGLCLLMLGCTRGGGQQSISILDGVFKVENNQSASKTVTVKTLDYRPTSPIYVVSGQVQYQDVEGAAYLEMWNIMPDGNRYFSRTVMDSGTMRKIQGTSKWRKFELPFNLMDAKPESVTLEINVVMPGKGTIELSDITIRSISL